MLVALVLAAAAAAADGSTWALLVNGGANPKSNYASHVVHLEEMFDVLVERGLDPDHVVVLSSDGPVTHVDQATRDASLDPPDAGLWEGTRASRLLPQISLVDTVWDRTPTIRQARKRSLAEAFAEVALEVDEGDTVFVYTTDHGSKDGKIRLWREDATVEEFRAWIAGFKPGVRVVVAMSQCYSGAFVDAVLPGAEAQFPDACGVFSVPADRRAYGCYPEGKDRFIGHGFRFIDALGRRATVDEAHSELLVTDRTPDVPLRSSDAFLASRLEAEAARMTRPLSVVVDELLEEAEPRRFEAELRVIDDIAGALGTFAPRTLGQLDTAADALHASAKMAQTYASRWNGARTFAAKEQLRRFEKANPDWSPRLDKEPAAALSDDERLEAMHALLPPLRDSVEQEGATERLAELHGLEARADELKWRMLTREAAVERMRWLLLRIAGTVLVERGPDADTLGRLVACEATALGRAPETSAPVDEPWPTLDADLAALETVAPSWLGVKYSPLKEEERVNGLQRGAARVTGVMEGSPAEKAGIAVDDILIGPPGEPFSEPQELRVWTQAQERGVVIPISGRREGRARRFELTLDRFPTKMPDLVRPEQGDPAPLVQERFHRLDGGVMPDLRGKRHLLFWWATWCGPCKLAVSELLKWSAETGVPVVAITDEDHEVWAKFERKWTAPFPELAVTDSARRSWAAYGVSATPTFVLVDEQGQVEWRQRGYNRTNGLSVPGWSGSP